MNQSIGATAKAMNPAKINFKDLKMQRKKNQADSADNILEERNTQLLQT